MNIAEAEQVLMALADPLRWRDSSSNCEGTEWMARCPGKTYAVARVETYPNQAAWQKRTSPRLRYQAWFYFNGNQSGEEYVTADDAKAACERHHQTGKWE